MSKQKPTWDTRRYRTIEVIRKELKDCRVIPVHKDDLKLKKVKK